MKIHGEPTRSIWPLPDGSGVGTIDQARLPHRLATLELRDAAAVEQAIRGMQVRGAP